MASIRLVPCPHLGYDVSKCYSQRQPEGPDPAAPAFADDGRSNLCGRKPGDKCPGSDLPGSGHFRASRAQQSGLAPAISLSRNGVLTALGGNSSNCAPLC
jgi:hypothetical protein